MYPSDYLYTKEHEWVSVDGDIATIGITQFAQRELGEVVFVELPEVGQSFELDAEVGTIESVKAVSEFFAPVSGEITERNESVIDDPELLNEDPHREGWLVKIRMNDESQLKYLMNADTYGEYTRAGEA